MSQTCLNVEFVEKMQIASAKGKSVLPFVASLESATLAGLAEYICLRFTHPAFSSFPPIPEPISSSPIGDALRQAQWRQNDPEGRPIKSLTPKPVEFYVLKNEEATLSTEWNNFCGRFELGAVRAGFPKRTAMNLHFALYEMATNAVIHSNSPTDALIGYQIGNGRAQFSVVDVGIGVLESLRSSANYKHLTRPVDAIHAALQPGVSRLGHGGTGFAQVFEAVAEDWGELRFRSGNGCLSMDGTGLNHDFNEVKRTYPPALPGFQVSMCCRIEPHGPNETAF